MTENGQYEFQPSSAGPPRPETESSVEQWQEILRRLREVHDSQARLAEAIEDLGIKVDGALGPEATSKVEAHANAVTVDPASPNTILAAPSGIPSPSVSPGQPLQWGDARERARNHRAPP